MSDPERAAPISFFDIAREYLDALEEARQIEETSTQLAYSRMRRHAKCLKSIVKCGVRGKRGD